jgi:hypothetical protein
VLSWYPGISLDQLEQLREGGSTGLDKAKLRQRARAIAECTNTDTLFDAGDSNESLDGADFEEPSSTEAPQKAPEDPADSSIPPSPSGDDFVLAARTGDAALLELMPCPKTFLSCMPMTFRPESLMYWFLVIYEPDLARPLSTFSFISPSFGPSTPNRQPGAGWSPLDWQPNASLGWERAAG